MSQYVVVALYQFVTLENYTTLRQPLLQVMLDNHVKGTLLLAKEGINGTVAGSRAGVDSLLAWLEARDEFHNVSYKESFDDVIPFYRTKVKLKKEIVTMGVADLDPKRVVGTYVEPKDWNRLIADPEVTVIDTRNTYEVNVGSFQHAVSPKTTSFREFPDYVASHLDPKKHKKVAMFCTGGIRCEKSTAYLKQQGFEEVYHLQGGILKYLEEVPVDESLWEGECFVFDNRVTVDHHLHKGHYDQCHACRLPITEEDKQHPHYVKGVSCPDCFDKHSDQQKQRFIERQKQVELAKKRHEAHIGSDMMEIMETHREQKLAIKNRQRELSNKH